jgi:NAD(P)-dependent dehydrogenase (short-subunit alcohol dehydrogenase family)
VTATLLEQIGKIIVAGVPLSRIGKPEDVGGTAVYLASPAASWMNGATLTLDGGAIVAMPSMRELAKL